jgi:hypothetical protein
MAARWHSYRARWHGDEYDAGADPRPDQLWMRLYASTPAAGFDEIGSGRYVRPVPAVDCEVVLYVTVVCEWRGAPFQVHGDSDRDLLLEYIGGLLHVAQRLRLQRIERGVYRTWVPRAEVRAMREHAVVLSQ